MKAQTVNYNAKGQMVRVQTKDVHASNIITVLGVVDLAVWTYTFVQLAKLFV
jgi:hypothetical protein